MWEASPPHVWHHSFVICNINFCFLLPYRQQSEDYPKHHQTWWHSNHFSGCHKHRKGGRRRGSTTVHQVCIIKNMLLLTSGWSTLNTQLKHSTFHFLKKGCNKQCDHARAAAQRVWEDSAESWGTPHCELWAQRSQGAGPRKQAVAVGRRARTVQRHGGTFQPPGWPTKRPLHCRALTQTQAKDRESERERERVIMICHTSNFVNSQYERKKCS